VEGLCNGVVLGTEALAGFPSLNTLRHTAQIGFHGVNVHNSESRNKSVVVHVENDLENVKPEKIAEQKIGKRTFVGWPFLQEGMVVGISDALFRYEKGVIIPGSSEKVLANPHSPQGMNHWKAKADKIEQTYSKRFGVITGPIDVLFHVRPLKGASIQSLIFPVTPSLGNLIRIEPGRIWCFHQAI
jgi:5'-3' exoribonuclease 1